MMNEKENSSELTLPQAIAFLRKKKEFSARQLSELAELSPSYVGKLEAGEVQPSLKAFCQLVRALNCTDYEIVFLIRLMSHPRG